MRKQWQRNLFGEFLPFFVKMNLAKSCEIVTQENLSSFIFTILAALKR